MNSQTLCNNDQTVQMKKRIAKNCRPYLSRYFLIASRFGFVHILDPAFAGVGSQISVHFACVARTARCATQPFSSSRNPTTHTIVCVFLLLASCLDFPIVDNYDTSVRMNR